MTDKTTTTQTTTTQTTTTQATTQLPKIKSEEYYWTCLCGNEPPYDGFYSSTETGKIVSPSIHEGWNEVHYVCHRCWRVIDQNTLEVVGRCDEETKLYNTHFFNWDSY